MQAHRGRYLHSRTIIQPLTGQAFVLHRFRANAGLQVRGNVGCRNGFQVSARIIQAGEPFSGFAEAPSFGAIRRQIAASNTDPRQCCRQSCQLRVGQSAAKVQAWAVRRGELKRVGHQRSHTFQWSQVCAAPSLTTGTDGIELR